jgi:hypothetical protein
MVPREDGSCKQPEIKWSRRQDRPHGGVVLGPQFVFKLLPILRLTLNNAKLAKPF